MRCVGDVCVWCVWVEVCVRIVCVVSVGVGCVCDVRGVLLSTCSAPCFPLYILSLTRVCPPPYRRRLPGSDMGYPTDAAAGGSTLSGLPSEGGDQPGPVVGCSAGLDCHLLRLNT